MRIAQDGADIGVSKQIFHCHDVYAAPCEAGSKIVAEYVPRYFSESRAFHGCVQCALDILVGVTGHRAIENIRHVLIAQPRLDGATASGRPC